MKTRQTSVRGITAVLLLIVTGSLSIASADDVDSSSGNAALTVVTLNPFRMNWPESVSSEGAIAPWQEAVVNAEISGARLTDVLVDVGDQVEKGQLLARFDSRTAEAMLAQQRAAEADASARLLEAEANEQRAEGLLESASISEQDVIKFRTAARAARAQMAAAEARVESQQIVVANTRVIAPDAGTISARSAMLGAVAMPGLELFRLIRQNRLEWQAELIDTALARVAIGNEVTVHVPGRSLPGMVRQISPQLNPSSRTGLVYVALADDAFDHARAGMFAGGNIVVGKRDGIAVPASAIVHRDGYEYVFTVDVEAGVVRQVKVASGRRQKELIEIVHGLSEEMTVVESGGAFLSDGDRVRVVPKRSEPLLGASR